MTRKGWLLRAVRRFRLSAVPANPPEPTVELIPSATACWPLFVQKNV